MSCFNDVYSPIWTLLRLSSVPLLLRLYVFLFLCSTDPTKAWGEEGEKMVW